MMTEQDARRPAMADQLFREVVRFTEALDADGAEWDVLIIQPGLSESGTYYPTEVLRAAAPLFVGVPMFRNHVPAARAHELPNSDPSELVGWIRTAQFVEEEGVRGRAHILASEQKIRRDLLEAHREGKTDLLGLSIEARGTGRVRRGEDGRLVRWAESIDRAVSVDVVTAPGAGGRFLRLAASASAGSGQEERVETLTTLTLEEFTAARPDLVAAIRTDAPGTTLARLDRKSTRLNSSHSRASRMPSSA